MTGAAPDLPWEHNRVWRSLGLAGYATLIAATWWLVFPPARHALAAGVSLTLFFEFTLLLFVVAIHGRRGTWVAPLGAAVMALICALPQSEESKWLLALPAALTALPLAAAYWLARKPLGLLVVGVVLLGELVGLLIGQRPLALGAWSIAMLGLWGFVAWSTLDTHRFDVVALESHCLPALKQAFVRQMGFSKRWYASTRFGAEAWRVFAAFLLLNVLHAAIAGGALAVLLLRNFGEWSRDVRLGWFVTSGAALLGIVAAAVPAFLLMRPAARWAARIAFALESWSDLQDPDRACRVWQFYADRRDSPYAVYLRSFAGEHADVPWFGARKGAQRGRRDAVELVAELREPDWTLAQVVAKHMPIFALGNRFDSIPPDDLGRIYSDDATWFDKFRMLVERAHLIIVYLTEETRGITEELEVLSRPEYRDRTVIIATSEVLVQWAKTLGYRRMLLDRGATDYAKLVAEPVLSELLTARDASPVASESGRYVGTAGIGAKLPWVNTFSTSRVDQNPADVDAHRDACAEAVARLINLAFRDHPTDAQSMVEVLARWAPAGRWESTRIKLLGDVIEVHQDVPLAPVFSFGAFRTGLAPDGSQQLYRPDWVERRTPRTASFEAVPMRHPSVKPSV